MSDTYFYYQAPVDSKDPSTSERPKSFNFLILLSILVIAANSCSKPEAIMKIGLVADPQYADKAPAGNRYYRESQWKLKEAIDTFNYHDVDFVQNLGDIVDTDWDSYDAILPIYAQLDPGIGNYHLLGNHDFSIDSAHLKDLLKTLSMPDYYYAYTNKDWRFLVLDATDYSYYSHSLHAYDTSQVNAYFGLSTGKPNHHDWNGAMGVDQLNWLRWQLDSAEALNQKVILFSHMPLRPQEDPHNVWNNTEILDIIENDSKVVAYINGHNHAGGYVFENGIHYITLSGMVDGMVSSYGILEIYQDSLALRGYGNQKTWHLKY